MSENTVPENPVTGEGPSPGPPCSPSPRFGFPRPGVQGVPTWIGGPDDYLSAWVHSPEGGTAEGVVVIAGPVGREAVITFRALRALAIACARSGLVAVRVSWRGDGGSHGLDAEPDPAGAWSDDMARVERYAAGLLPGHGVTTLGLRLGCAIAARTGTAGGLISWEPIDGRHQLRQQQLLRSVAVQIVPDDDLLETPARSWTPRQAASVRGLALGPEHAARATVVTEEDGRVAERLYAVAPHLARVPWESLDRIVGMIPCGPASDLVLDPARSVATRHGGALISEEFVSVDGLPGVLTRPAGEPRLAVVFTSTGGEPRDGGAGLWAQSARELAAAGAASLRCERNDQGDAYSGRTDGEPNPFNDQGVADCVAAIRALRTAVPRTPLMTVGACIGMWLFGRAAEQVRIDRLVILNPTGWNPRASHYRHVLEGPWLKKHLQHLRVDHPLTAEGAANGFSRYERTKQAAKRTRQRLLRLAPRRAWTLLARAGVFDDAAILLSRVPATTAVQMHIGEDDAPHWRTERGDEAVARLSARGRAVTGSHESTLDHSLLAGASRVRARRIIMDAALGLMAAGRRDDGAPEDRADEGPRISP